MQSQTSKPLSKSGPPYSSLQACYAAFNDFIQRDIQLARSQVNRRMFSVFLWCFLLPALVSAAFLLLIKFGIFPRSARVYLEWIALLFPLFYSIYFLSSQVLVGATVAFRRGGVGTTLSQNTKEGEWRVSVCDSMNKELFLKADQWEWVIASLRMDLSRLQYRNRYLTALAGAVFYLIMQGIDSLGGSEEMKMNVLINPSNDFTQFVGLALFLVLLYLSGTQTISSLQKYLDCAELLQIQVQASSPAVEK
ncbi:MAG: hypothetical protein H7222_06660 [Methylotenera sp.]|nr:hypothetical protein [Oligoflexia bacterium]